MFTSSDLAQLHAHGISQQRAEKQMEAFKTGFPELDIVAPAAVGNGILRPSEEETEEYIRTCLLYTSPSPRD